MDIPISIAKAGIGVIYSHFWANQRKEVSKMLFNLNSFRLIAYSILILLCTIRPVLADMKLPIDSAQHQVIQIANAYEKAYFDHFPESGLLHGARHANLDRFTDYSLNGYETWRQQEDAFLEQLQAIRVEALKGSREYITYQLLKQSLENSRAIRICKDELWAVDPLFGWHIVLSILAEKQPVGTPEYRQKALKRWQTLNGVVDQQIHNLQAGLREGYTAPQPVVRRVLNQIKMMIDAPVEDSPFFDFAKRDNDPHFKRQMAQLIQEKMNPALKRYAIFLENEYLPKAREKIGLSALPNGEQCYQAKVLKETTLTISPMAIHQYGLTHMQQLSREVGEIGYREFGIQDMPTVFKRTKHDPKYWFSSEKEQLEYNYTALARAKEKVSAWFKVFPKAEGAIKPYPLHRAKTGSPGEYHPPSDDGKQPGIFYINTYQAEKRSRVDQEATLFHELIPGHHFEVALVYEDTSQHSLNKYLRNAGYSEGWALYVERLADEMGLYKDDISRLGMLSNESLRTARLVVDPGIHVMNWTREEAIDYMKKHTAMDEAIIEAEVDRYTMRPGQATSYMLGKREIEMLRDKAQAVLGKSFDIRDYHEQVLKNGTITLPMLSDQINEWLESKKT
jgi:uncharacterized protein (DUF885 family)